VFAEVPVVLLTLLLEVVESNPHTAGLRMEKSVVMCIMIMFVSKTKSTKPKRRTKD
jgi:hypothetical protein